MSPFIIAAHHLHRILRSPGLIGILLAIPVTLAALEYAAFGPTVASGKLPPIKVIVLDEDNSFLSRGVPQVFTSGGPLKDMFETGSVDSRDAARTMFRRNEAAALVIVPAGFQAAVLSGGRGEVQFVGNPLQSFSPQIARSVLDMAVVLGNGLYQQAAAPIQRINALRAANQQATSEDVAEISRGFFDAAQRLNGLKAVTNVSVTEVRPTGQTRGPASDPRIFFAFVFPGLVIFGAMFISQSLALRLLRDRVRGVERRLTMTPVSGTSRIAGSFLFMLTGVLIVVVLLMIVGTLLFRIELRNPQALALFALGFAVVAAALQLVIVGLAASERTASFISSGVIMILSLLGGTFVPAEEYPALLRRVAYMIPNGAAQQGLVDLLAHGRTFAEVSLRLTTVWIWAAVLTLLAALVSRPHARRA
jgi:ABC-2 type transport system permease protein